MTRSTRRWLVAGLAATCSALLLLGLLRVRTPLAFALIGLLLADDVLLLHVTSRVGELPEGAVDERQEMIRNRAYRLSYRVITQIIVWPAALIVVLASFGDPHGWLHALWSNTALVVALGVSATQLVVFLPTMMLAWTQPDPIEPE